MNEVHIFVQEFADGQKMYWTDAESAFVRRYISKQEMRERFGGYYRARRRGFFRFLFAPALIGVYGEKRGSQFRQLLRERGAAFEVVHDAVRQSVATILRKEKRQANKAVDPTPGTAPRISGSQSQD